MEALVTGPQARWEGGRSPVPMGLLTANGETRFPTESLSPAVTSEMVTSGWSPQELTAEVLLTDFQKEDWGHLKEASRKRE